MIMKKLCLLAVLFLSGINYCYAQNATTLAQDIANRQGDIASQQSSIGIYNSNIAQAQAAISQDNVIITNDQNELAIYNANHAQVPTDVNWDYMALLESDGTLFTGIQPITPGINWTSIVPALGITCSVTQTQVNWNNWFSCEGNGVQGGVSIGTYTTGWGAFYCGQGHVSGKC